MRKILFACCLLSLAAWAERYAARPGGAAPGELAGPVRDLLQGQGVRVVDDNNLTFCEVWFRGAPIDSTSMEEALNQGTIPRGAVVGAVRFAAPSADRNGRGFRAGVYTLRYREGDSVALIPAGGDQNPDPAAFDEVAGQSRGTLRFGKGPEGQTPRFEMTRRGEWVVHSRIGDTPVALLVTGVAGE